MLRVSLGAAIPLQPVMQSPSSSPTTGWSISPKVIASLLKTTMASCPASYTKQDGLCLSPGCIDGRSPCVVRDSNMNTCTYDQMLATWQSTGVKSCPAPGSTAPQETGVFTNPAAGGAPIPGTQATPPSPGSQPPPEGLPSQSTQPGVVIDDKLPTSASDQSIIVGLNWKRIGLVALGLAAVGMVIAARRKA